MGLESRNSPNTPLYGTHLRNEKENSTVHNSDVGYANNLPFSVKPKCISIEITPSTDVLSQGEAKNNYTTAENTRVALKNADAENVQPDSQRAALTKCQTKLRNVSQNQGRLDDVKSQLDSIMSMPENVEATETNARQQKQKTNLINRINKQQNTIKPFFRA